MKGQEFDMCDLPFDGYYAPQAEIKRRPWGCPLSRHHNYQGSGPFGRPGFDHGLENQGHPFGPDHHRFGRPEDGERRHGWGRWGPTRREGDGPAEHNFQGPPGFRASQDGRPQDEASGRNFGAQSWWFGRRGPSEAQERPWTGPSVAPGTEQRA